VVARGLTDAILDGTYPHGHRLPSEMELAARFGVSRSTVRRALHRTQLQGLVEPRPGVGWMVLDPHRSQDLNVLRSFSEWARHRGLQPGGHVLRSTRADPTPHERRMLDLRSHDRVLRVERLRTLDGEPASVERTAYASWVSAIVEELPRDAPSVETALRRLGVDTAYARSVIDAIAATNDDAELLHVRRSSPLLRMERTTSAVDGRPIACSDDRYRPGVLILETRSRRVP
jgi:GntR family transcriptional regulator